MDRAAAYRKRGQEDDIERAIEDYAAVIAMADAPADQKARALVNRGARYARRGQEGDIERAIDDYAAVIAMADAPADQKARALVNRGARYARRGQEGDIERAIDDYAAVIAMADAPADQKARALVNRGFRYGQRGQEGDTDREIADYNSVISMADAPAAEKASALINRGVTYGQRGQEGDTDREIADYSSVISMADAPAAEKARALINRGITYGQRSHEGDTNREIADYNSVIGMADAPADQKARALVNRGITYGQRSQEGDSDREIADYNSVIGMADAPAEHKARALINRGITYSQRGQEGDTDRAIADYNSVIAMPDAPADQKADALLNRGAKYGQRRQEGDTDRAIADYNSVIGMPDAPAERKAEALFNRAVSFGHGRETRKATDDFRTMLKDSEAPAILQSKAQMYWKLLSQDPSGKSFAAARNLIVKLDENTKKEFRQKLHKERERKKAFFGESQFDKNRSFLLVAREWNSFTPAIPEIGEPSRGGGYFLQHYGVGIVVDPGFDFLQIFAEAGGTLCDIDHVVITHAHNDHTAEFEAILTLLYAYNHPGPGEPKRPPRQINVYLNQGAARKFAGMLPLRDSEEIRKVVTLSRGTKEHPFVVPILENEDVLLTVLPAYHDDVLTVDSAVGLGFELRCKNGLVRHIVFTGDTSLSLQIESPDDEPPQSVNEAYPEPYCGMAKCDLLIAHIGTITERDLMDALGVVEATSQTFVPSISRQASHPDFETFNKRQDPKKKPREEGKNHLRLQGVFAVTYALQPKAAIVSEFGEELKTIWIKAVQAIQTRLSDVLESGIPVFAGDPMLIYDIEHGQFLCHEDHKFHDPQELRTVGIYEERDTPNQRHPRPFLFLKSGDKDKHDSLEFDTAGNADPSDYEDTIQQYRDKLNAFHKKWDDRDLPHFKPKPLG